MKIILSNVLNPSSTDKDVVRYECRAADICMSENGKQRLHGEDGWEVELDHNSGLWHYQRRGQEKFYRYVLFEDSNL